LLFIKINSLSKITGYPLKFFFIFLFFLFIFKINPKGKVYSESMIRRRKKPQKNGNPKENQEVQAGTTKERWWNARASHIKKQGYDEVSKPSGGRKPYFETPEELWEACCEYFEWVEENPEYKSELVTYKGHGRIVEVPKKRAMTLTGLEMFLGMRPQTWWDYRDNKSEGFTLVCEAAQRVIWIQKFTGAAADLLNHAIIARDLGLKDSYEVSGPGGRPIQTENKTKLQLDLSNLSNKELDILEKVVSRVNPEDKG